MNRKKAANAESRALGFCHETCYEVDRLASEFSKELRDAIAPELWGGVEVKLESLIEHIKDAGTRKLRGALIEACGELIEAEAEVENLECRVEHLERELYHALSDAP